MTLLAALTFGPGGDILSPPVARAQTSEVRPTEPATEPATGIVPAGAEATPTEPTPAEAAPVETDPGEATSTEVVPTEVVPTEATPTEAVSTGAEPTGAGPAEAESAEAAPLGPPPVPGLEEEDLPEGAAPEAAAGEAPPEPPAEAAPEVPAKSPEEWARTANPVPADEASIERGRSVYMGEGLCAVCHGDKGDGFGPVRDQFTPPPNAFVNAEWQGEITDGGLMGVLHEGKFGTGMMAMVPDFITEEEAWDVINYLRTFSGKTTEAYARGQAAQAAREAERQRKIEGETP